MLDLFAVACMATPSALTRKHTRITCARLRTAGDAASRRDSELTLLGRRLAGGGWACDGKRGWAASVRGHRLDGPFGIPPTARKEEGRPGRARRARGLDSTAGVYLTLHNATPRWRVLEPSQSGPTSSLRWLSLGPGSGTSLGCPPVDPLHAGSPSNRTSHAQLCGAARATRRGGACGV